MSGPDSVCGVVTDLPAYMGAVAELPASAEITEKAQGAVVVVPGSGDWWQGLLAARAAGAAAVVLSDPRVLPPQALAAGPWEGLIPVIVERPRLRPDVVADAVRARRSSPARMVVAECAAPGAGLDGAILDGLGWARSLAGGRLVFRAGVATVQGRMALLDSQGVDNPVPATVMAVPVGGLQAGGLLKVLALGEVRTEVTVDQPAGLVRVETFTEQGALRAPDRFESPARLALRRALDACLSGRPVTDLDELLEDMALARNVLDC